MNQPHSDNVDYFTSEQLDRFYTDGCAALERYEGADYKTCNLVTNCEVDFCNTFANTIVDDFLQRHPEQPPVKVRLHVMIDIHELLQHPLGRALIHAAGHYFLSMGVGLSVSEEIR